MQKPTSEQLDVLLMRVLLLLSLWPDEATGDEQDHAVEVNKDNLLTKTKKWVWDTRFFLRDLPIRTGGIPVRYFHENDDYEIVEITEFEFTRDSSDIITYERHTVYANGVDQICLTKWHGH